MSHDPLDPPGPDARRPRLAVAYDITSSSPMDLLGILRDVCDIVWVTDTTDARLGPMGRLLTRSGTVVDTAGLDEDEIVAAVTAAGVDGVVAFTDSQLRIAARLADALDLPGNPLPAVAALLDKHRQREAMAAAGIAVPGFRRIPAGSGRADVEAIAADLTFPVVLKPLRGDSSRDVVSVTDPGALADAFATADRGDGDFIAEEFLADRPRPDGAAIGSYVSVEAVVQDGAIVPVALTGKFPLSPPFRESGNFMPHPLDAAEAGEVLVLAEATAAALDVRSGALHIEIKLTPAGPRVIEVNGRIGGGAIDVLHTRRFGRSLTELAARVALGQPLDLAAEPRADGAGPFLYEFFAQPPVTATALRAITGLDAVVGTTGAAEAHVNKSPGDLLDWRNGSQGYVLRVSGTADDLATLGAVPTAVAAAAAIEYDEA